MKPLYSNSARIAFRGKMHFVCRIGQVQKNRLIEKIHFISHKICFGLEISKLIFHYAIFSGGRVWEAVLQ